MTTSALPAAVRSCRVAVALKDFINESAGLQTVEVTNTTTKHVDGDLFHLGFIEALFSHDLFDEVALLVTALPLSTSAAVGVVMTVSAIDLVAVIAAVMPGTVIRGAMVAAIRQKPDVLDGLIHRILQQAVKPAAFLFDLREIGQLGADGDRILVRGETREAQFLRIDCFNDEAHDVDVV